MSKTDVFSYDTTTTVDSSIKPKSPQRTFVDVIRRGSRRRGYITIRRGKDETLEVGFSLCELRDKFKGSLGLDIALKRGVRLSDKKSYVRNDSYSHIPYICIGNGNNNMTALPATILPRLLRDVEQSTEIFGRHADVKVPTWVEELRNSSVLNLIHTNH